MTANQSQIPNQSCNISHSLFYFPVATVTLSPYPSFVFLISPLRRIANHVSLAPIVLLWGCQCLQANAGKVSFVWGEQIVLTPLLETTGEDLAQKVIGSFSSNKTAIEIALQ